MSTVRWRVLPTRKKARVSSARKSLTWLSGSISPISSRNSVPPSASSMSPGLTLTAPVKAPFSCPKSSLSSTSRGRAPQWIGTKAWPRRPIVNGAGHELFAGPALAEDEHRRLRGRDAVDQPEDLLHLGIGRDDAAVAALGAQPGAQEHILAHQSALLRRLANQDVQLLDAGRLGQVVVSAQLHGLDRRRHLLEAGHHNDLGRLRVALQRAEN